MSSKHNNRHVMQIHVAILYAMLTLMGTVGNVSAQWTTNGNNINNTNSGNVGIGTASPGTTLDVSGNILTLGSDFGLTTRTNNATKLNRLAMPPFTSTNLNFAVIAGATTSTDNIVGVGGAAGGFAASTVIVFHTAATTNTDTGTERMRITSAGNVGIGATNPNLQSGQTNKMLEIQGSINPGLALTATSAGGRQFFLYSAQTNPGYFAIFDAAAITNRFVINSNGDVGIGNSDPQSTLQIGTQTGSATANPVRLSLGGTFSNIAGTNFKLRLYDDGVAANIYGIGVSAGSMDFGVSPTAAYNWYSGGAHKMILTSAGNVGVGTNAPTAKLHVAGDGKVTGNLTVDGNIAAKYQDVAEWVPAAHALPVGTVVTLNRSQSNLVEASTKAYDTRVAGVISEKPGIVLGERGENKVLVATTGRVKIKVDAANGPIEIGDLLVTSEKEGVAMKSMPINVGGVEIHRPGTLIGKALEPLEKGAGEIMVLLSLQ